MFNKVIVSKKILKKSFIENEELEKTLSRFIENSIKARVDISTRENPCKVDIIIFENFISIVDNSGGIDPNIKDEEIFKIGTVDNTYSEGIGIKKSFFILGNKMNMESNNKKGSRKFLLDTSLDYEELRYQVENTKYNPEKVEGTSIYITSLENNIREKISQSCCEESIIIGLGRIFSKFIENGELQITVNTTPVNAIGICGEKINSCTILGEYQVDLYKGVKGSKSGVDLFINGYMFYNREKSKDVKWNLSQAKHRYNNCIIEISYNGDKLRFLESHDVLFDKVLEFIKENEQHFRSKTIIIQFEADIGKVEELEEYYDENTAKAIGIKAFEQLYQKFIENTR
ncbi:ATP-binding protein [Paraclostridium bifermentans]|uniref:ATP-binding protein n=1 Tax=Paraclostridium bifermentans TaxID=1490 RepID=UPI00189C90B6|nr:ATP-binding protein [Paraclostridium bifermentans]